MTDTTFTVNGQTVRYAGEGRTHLADFLRESLFLTGTHIGCEHGVCGACTLIKDGQPVRSCITFAAACNGATIRSVEDFHDDPVMIRLRTAFKAHHALQCGFCTPGMLATAYDIVTRLPMADEARVREELSGNLCRCTGYMGIVAAIRAVLADGPFDKPVAPARAPQIAALSFGTSAPVNTAIPASPRAATAKRPAEIIGGTTLTRAVDLDLSAAQVWDVLSDIEGAASCLPGAAIDRIGDDGSVDGSYTTRIGPMKTIFRGTAFVSYVPGAMFGSVAGSGGDTGSRSQVAGEIGFALTATGPEDCRLDCTLSYKLGGPLAQVGRPRIVEGIVDRVLSDFTANIEAKAHGQTLADRQSVNLLSLIFAGIRNIFPKWHSK